MDTNTSYRNTHTTWTIPIQIWPGLNRHKQDKTLQGLSILGDIDLMKIKGNIKSQEEIKRMKRDASLTVTTRLSVTANSDYCFRVRFLNVNSLLPHARAMETDKNMTSANIICLSETWLKHGDECPDLPHFQVLWQDNITAFAQHRSDRLLMYIGQDYHMMRHYSLPDVITEHLIALLSPRQAPESILCFTVAYKNPRLTDRDFLRELERMISERPVRAVPTMISSLETSILTCSRNKSVLKTEEGDESTMVLFS